MQGPNLEFDFRRNTGFVRSSKEANSNGQIFNVNPYNFISTLSLL